MKMKQTQFELIAQVIRNYPSHAPSLRESFANAFADALVPTNPRFDRAKFLAQCGVAS